MSNKKIARSHPILSSMFFIIAGFLFLIAGWFIIEQWINVPDFSNIPTISKHLKNTSSDFELSKQYPELIAHDNVPDQLKIPSLNIDLPIEIAQYQQNNWNISSRGISMIILPNQSRLQYILYGHNWPKLLGSLSDVQTGEEILLLRDGQTVATAHITNQKVYQSNQFEQLIGTSDVVIYTCTGWFDRERLVVTATINSL